MGVAAWQNSDTITVWLPKPPVAHPPRRKIVIVRRVGNLIGHRFNHLEVIGKVGVRGLWECRCDCGKVIQLNSVDLSKRRSCGCKRAEYIQTSRGLKFTGMSDTPEYQAWTSMLCRCGHRGSKPLARYAGRGISVCDRWLDNFDNFLADMGHRPSAEHSIDRIDNDLGYFPQNCRWATRDIQATNRATTVFIEHEGERHSMSQWSRVTGIPTTTIRLWASHGLTLAEMMTRTKRMAARITVDGKSFKVADAGEIIGVSRVTAYRLYRAGKLIERFKEHITS